MADDPPIRINQLPTRAAPGRVAAARSSSRSKSDRASSKALSASSTVVPPLSPALLGKLSSLSGPTLFQSTLEALQRTHGGWGWVIYRVDDSIALGSGTETDASRVIIMESVATGADLIDRYRQAGPELIKLATEPAALAAIEAGESITCKSELAGQRCHVQALPLFDGDSITACLCRVHGTDQRNASAALGGLQVGGLLRLLEQERAEKNRIRSRFGKVAAFVEMLGSSETGTDFAECSRRLANHLREVLECDTVALAVRRLGRNKLAAVSGETGPSEAHSPGRRALMSHLSEAIHRGQPLLFKKNPDAGDESGHSTAGALTEWFDPALSLCLPLTDSEGRIRGGWLFLWKEYPHDLEEKEALIKAASPEVAPLLGLLHRAKPGPLVGSVLRLWKRGTLNQRRLMAGSAIALGLALLTPLRYPVATHCELQPVVRRVIAAPFDGILRRSSVRAGETVKAGQLLAELDGREIRSQLSEAIARHERAVKNADSALAADQIAEARMAELEAEGLSHEIERLKYRQQHLQVRSPIDGLVLQGDLERSEGAPLRMGDPLFEVGPLDRLVVEFEVDATDISLVETGDSATLKLEAYTGDKIETTIQRVSPKSEWQGDKNVFIGEAEIENPDGDLRAGLEGKGKIHGPRRPLAWIWVRDAWLALRYHLW